MFKLQELTGTYSKAECLSSNNLILNLMLQPEVLEDLIISQQGYSLAYLTMGLGQYGKGKVRQMTHHQRMFEWGVLGRLQRTTTWVRYVSGTGTGGFGEVVAVAADDALNPNDLVGLSNGQQVVVIGKATRVVDGWQYRLRFNATSSTDAVTTSALGMGKKAGVIGNVYPNGSIRGFGQVRYPDKYHQWSTISRAGIDWDNEGILSVVWYRNPANGKKMWCFEQQKQILDNVLWQMEFQKWFQRMTTYDGGTTWLKDENNKDLIAGAGYKQQTDGANYDTYVPYVSNVVEKLKDRINALIIDGSAIAYNQIACHTGMANGTRVFHAAMQDDFQKGYKTLFYSPTEGAQIEVGEAYKSYNFNGKEVVLMGNMVFEDQNTLTETITTAHGTAPKEAFNFYFMPVSADENANVCALSRRSIDGQIARDFVAKQFRGMIAIGENSTALDDAVTSVDGYREEYLFEHGVVVFDPRKSARLEAASA